MAETVPVEYLIEVAGATYELNYTTGSMMWLIKKHSLNVVVEISKIPPKIIETPEGEAQQYDVMDRVNFIMSHIDIIAVAGIMNEDDTEPLFDASVIRKLPASYLPTIVNPVTSAVFRDCFPAKPATANPTAAA